MKSADNMFDKHRGRLNESPNLLLANACMAAMLEATPDLVLAIDSEEQILHASSQMALTAILPPDSLYGKYLADIFPSEVSSQFSEALASLSQDLKITNIIFEMQVHNEIRNIRARLAHHDVYPSPSIYTIVFRDITGISSKKKFEGINYLGEMTSNQVLVIDPKGRIKWVNPAFEHLTGWLYEEVLGKKPGDFLKSDKADIKAMIALKHAIQNILPYKGQVLNRTKSGIDYWVQIEMQPLFDDEGDHCGFIEVQTDITDIKKAHARAMREHLLALDRSIDAVAIGEMTGGFTYGHL